MPAVSVIIPTYNGARYLAQAIDSALSQSYRDLEVVVVNDGSTDEKVDAIAKSFGSRIRYFRKTEKCGQAAARNCGIAASQGEFVAFLDDDDWWETEKIEQQVFELDQDGAVDLVFTDMSVHLDDGSTIPSFLQSRPLASAGYVFDRLIHSQFIFPSTVLLRRSCLQQAGLFDESMPTLEDCDFFLRLCYTRKVAMIRRPLVHRRQRAGNMSSNIDLGTRTSIILFEKALRLPHLTASRKRELRRRLSFSCLERGSYCLQQGRVDEGRKSLQLSLRHNWTNRSALRCLLGSCLPPRMLAQARSWRNQLQGGHGL